MDTTSENLKDDMATTTESMRKMVGTAAELAMDTAKEMGAGVSSRISETATTVRDGAVERLEATRDALSESGDRLAETLRRAASEPPDGSVQARVMTAAADGLESVAGEIRNASLSGIMADVRAFAERNPAAFAAGAALAGFMLARFLRSSAET